jgi:putative hydrolase of the HAD superfamily
MSSEPKPVSTAAASRNREPGTSRSNREPGTNRKPDWARIDTVCLDMDGTVLDLEFDNHFWLELLPQRYAERHGLSLDDTLERLRPRFAAKQGTLAWYCVDHWSAELALDLPAMKQELRGRIRFLPGALEFLEAVRATGRRLLLTTNAHPISLAIKSAETSLAGRFDALVSSHEYGAPKESSQFWARLVETHAIDPSRTLFVDDSEAVLDAARAAGVAEVWRILRPDSTRPSRALLGPGERAVDALAELSPPAGVYSVSRPG